MASGEPDLDMMVTNSNCLAGLAEAIFLSTWTWPIILLSGEKSIQL
jgi:hypothetical protein